MNAPRIRRAASPRLQGSALPIIRWASLLLTLLCVALAVVTVRANGLLVLASLFLAVHLWAAGAFTRRFWS